TRYSVLRTGYHTAYFSTHHSPLTEVWNVSFKGFIYYCACCGGWAALIAWGLAFAAGLTESASVSQYTRSMLIAGILGLFVAAAIGFLDALMNSPGAQRLGRIVVALVVGFVGGLLGGAIGEALHSGMGVPRVAGW